MLDCVSNNTTCILWISVFSLAWFIVGLSAGKRLGPAKKKPKPRTGAAKKDRRDRNAKGAKSPGSKSDGSSTELYVGNLSYNVTSDELNKAFATYGKVRGVRIIENRFNGKSKGFAFVDMGSPSDAEAAIKGLNGKEMDGRKLVVNIARSRAKD